MDDIPLVLAFDTSGPWIGATLLRGADVLGEVHQDMAKGQGERLFLILEELLADGGVTWQELAAIGVGVGPGNFTGIRISVSAARGLGLSLGIPVVGVSLLEAYAFGRTVPTLASVQAPRDQAYVQGFLTKADIAPQLVALDEIPKDWEEPGLVCVGSASQAIDARMAAKSVPTISAPAIAIAHITLDRMHDNPAAPVPMYLRPADAAPSREAPPVILDGP